MTTLHVRQLPFPRLLLPVTSFVLHVGEHKKILCQLLSKLHLPDTVDENKIQTLKLLIYNVQSVSEQ